MENLKKGRNVKVGKIDLDTVGAAYLLGVTREDMVEVLRGTASLADLSNPEVVCIEVGGSGQFQLNNWDHHEVGGPADSATIQVFYSLYNYKMIMVDEQFCYCSKHTEKSDMENGSKKSALSCYINTMDVEGPHSLPGYGKVGFPTLSDVLAGLFLTERNPVEQLHKGVELLSAVVDSGQDPFGTIKGFEFYAEAKAENNRQIAKAMEDARWDTTTGGLKLGFLETKFFGAPGALYGSGAQVVVAFNPDLNGVRKFTIAGNNGIRVDTVAPILKELESGWGGPPTGTILGSPREGSKLSLEEVVRIVKTTL